MKQLTNTNSKGFTLIELLIVMGILSGFLLMLVQLVDTGLRMFRDGEVSQVLADRGSQAQRVITAELGQLQRHADEVGAPARFQIGDFLADHDAHR